MAILSGLGLAAAVLSQSGMAGPTYGTGTDRFLSTDFAYGFIGLGFALPYLERDRYPTQQFDRTAEAFGAVVALTEGLKAATRVPRWDDKGDRDSFPSGHASACFAIATMRSAMRPSQAVFWYAGAVAVSISRVRLHRHRPLDILAGAALGFGIARWELGRHNGFLGSGVVTRPTSDLESFRAMPAVAGWQPIIGAGYGVAYNFRF